MAQFRKILLFILIISLIDALVFKAPLYSLSYSEIKTESNELSKEELYLELQHLPLVFIYKQNSANSISSNIGSAFQISFGNFPRRNDSHEFTFSVNLNHISTGLLIPIFIKVRSLRN